MRNLFSLAFLLRREPRIHFFLWMNSAQFQSRNKRKVRKLENEFDWGKFERSSGIDYREEQEVSRVLHCPRSFSDQYALDSFTTQA